MPESPLIFVSFAFALGLVIGSFLNVVIHRMPREESLVRPGSRYHHVHPSVSSCSMTTQ